MVSVHLEDLHFFHTYWGMASTIGWPTLLAFAVPQLVLGFFMLGMQMALLIMLIPLGLRAFLAGFGGMWALSRIPYTMMNSTAAQGTSSAYVEMLQNYTILQVGGILLLGTAIAFTWKAGEYAH